MTSNRPRVLIVIGFFDWFSGYQEVGLARALGKVADVQVVCSDRVNPVFTGEHLESIGVERNYASGTTSSGGVEVTRMPVHEWRSMVWPSSKFESSSIRQTDLLIQMMPGQMLPFALRIRNSRSRFVVYGDNTAMYAGLPSWLQKAKQAVFALTKGMLYRQINRGADRLLAYTPNTITKIEPFRAGAPVELLPLAFDTASFYFDSDLRQSTRREFALPDDALLIVAPGKLQRQKHLGSLVQAIASLEPWRDRVRLMFVGGTTGAVADEIRDLAHSLDLEASVTLLPFADASKLNAIFNAADLGVWPLMPAITIQQAMGTGLPVLLPENDLVSHLIRPGTGHLYRPCSDIVESLAETLETILPQVASPPENARQERTSLNQWLGTTAVANQLLEAAGLYERT